MDGRRATTPWTRRLTVAAMVLAAGLAVLDVVAAQAFNTARGTLNGVPYQMLFFPALVLGLGAAGDRTRPAPSRTRSRSSTPAYGALEPANGVPSSTTMCPTSTVTCPRTAVPITRTGRPMNAAT